MQRAVTSTAALLCCGLLLGQNARWEASVTGVSAKGLYAILLGPELLGASRPDLGDIRLVDSTGTDVPYVIEEEMTRIRSGHFEPYVLLRNEVLRNATVIEMEKPATEDLEELHIWIRPSQVKKHVRVTGSDDRHAWYMVKDDHVVAQGAHGDPPHQVLFVEIPRSDYRYLRIALNDSLTPPMQVLGVGRFVDGSSAQPRYTSQEPLLFAQSDTGQTSILRIVRSTPLLIEQLGFEVADTGTFRRNGSIVAWRKEVIGHGRRKRTERLGQHHGSFVLASDVEHLMEIEPLRSESFDIVIENGDDRPLRIAGLWSAARQRMLLAQLDPGMRYRLTTGDTQLDPPHYDMVHFANELPAPLDTLSHGALVPIARGGQADPAFDPSRMWIWAVIIALMLGMGWMAIRMLRKH